MKGMMKHCLLLFLVFLSVGYVEAQRANVNVRVYTSGSYSDGLNPCDAGDVTSDFEFSMKVAHRIIKSPLDTSFKYGNTCRTGEHWIEGSYGSSQTDLEDWTTNASYFGSTQAYEMIGYMDAWEDDNGAGNWCCDGLVATCWGDRDDCAGDRCTFHGSCVSCGFISLGKSGDDECHTELWTGPYRFRNLGLPNTTSTYTWGGWNGRGTYPNLLNTSTGHRATQSTYWYYNSSTATVPAQCFGNLTYGDATIFSKFGDYDIPSWSMYLYEGRVYQFSTVGGSSEDTYLRLFGTDGKTLVVENDDATGCGSCLQSTVTYTVPAGGSGIYYVELSRWVSSGNNRGTLNNTGTLSYSDITPVPISGTVTPSSTRVCYTANNLTFTAAPGAAVTLNGVSHLGTFVKFQYQWDGTGGTWNDWLSGGNPVPNGSTWTTMSENHTLYMRAVFRMGDCTGNTPAVAVIIDGNALLGTLSNSPSGYGCSGGDIVYTSTGGTYTSGYLQSQWNTSVNPSSWVSNTPSGTLPDDLPITWTSPATQTGTFWVRACYINGQCTTPQCTNPVSNTFAYTPVSVSISPTSGTYCSGTNVTLTATPSSNVTSTLNPSYRWLVDGVYVTGSSTSTSYTYTVATGSTPGSSQSVQCELTISTNPPTECGSPEVSLSSAAVFTIGGNLSAPNGTVSLTPSTSPVCAGTQLTLACEPCYNNGSGCSACTGTLGTNCNMEYSYSTDDGITWGGTVTIPNNDHVYFNNNTPAFFSVYPNSGQNRNLIRARKVGCDPSGGCSVSDFGIVGSWTVVPAPTAPTTAGTVSPAANSTVCHGATLSMTTDASGGTQSTGCSIAYQKGIPNPFGVQVYTNVTSNSPPVANFTADTGSGSPSPHYNTMRAYRSGCTYCSNSAYSSSLVQWTVVPQPQTISSLTPYPSYSVCPNATLTIATPTLGEQGTGCEVKYQYNVSGDISASSSGWLDWPGSGVPVISAAYGSSPHQNGIRARIDCSANNATTGCNTTAWTTTVWDVSLTAATISPRTDCSPAYNSTVCIGTTLSNANVPTIAACDLEYGYSVDGGNITTLSTSSFSAENSSTSTGINQLWVRRTNCNNACSVGPWVEIGKWNVTVQPEGAVFVNAIDLGTMTGCDIKTNTQANNSASNCYNQDYSTSLNHDVYYRFHMDYPATVAISSCGTGFSTQMTLLDHTGAVLSPAGFSNSSTGAPGSCTSGSFLKYTFSSTQIPANVGGKEFYIVVSGGSTNPNTGTISLTVSIVRPNDPDYESPSQTLSGSNPTTICPTTPTTYAVNSTSYYRSGYYWSFDISGPTFTTSQTDSSSISVTWGNNGAGVLSCYPTTYGGTCRASTAIGTVSITPSVNPITVSMVSYTPAVTGEPLCAGGTNVTIGNTVTTTYNAAAISYWQNTTSGGTSTTTSGNQVIAPIPSVSTTYYYRQYDAATSCWGVEASYTLEPNAKPAPTTVTPTGTLGSGSNYCGTVTLTADNGNDGTMYWQSNVPNGTSTLTPSTSQTVTGLSSTSPTNETHYFRARSSAGCWGNVGSASVTAYSLPPNPVWSPSTVNACGTSATVVTSTTDVVTNAKLYWQDTNTGGTCTTCGSASGTAVGANFSTTVFTGAPTTYNIRRLADASGCWSDDVPVVVTITPNPAVPSITSISGIPNGLTAVSGFSATLASASSGANSISTTAITGTGTPIVGMGVIGTNIATSTTITSISGTSPSYTFGLSTPTTGAISSGATLNFCMDFCGSVTLAASNGSSTDKIYWQGTTASGSASSSYCTNCGTSPYESPQTIQNTTSSTVNYSHYYFKAESNGCWSSASALLSPATIAIRPLPTTPSISVSPSIACSSSGAVLNPGSAVANTTVYWQTSSSGSSSSGLSGTSTVTTPTGTAGTDYWARRLSTSGTAATYGCWSNAAGPLNVKVLQTPATPTIDYTWGSSMGAGVGITGTKGDNYAESYTVTVSNGSGVSATISPTLAKAPAIGTYVTKNSGTGTYPANCMLNTPQPTTSTVVFTSGTSAVTGDVLTFTYQEFCGPVTLKVTSPDNNALYWQGGRYADGTAGTSTSYPIGTGTGTFTLNNIIANAEATSIGSNTIKFYAMSGGTPTVGMWISGAGITANTTKINSYDAATMTVTLSSPVVSPGITAGATITIGAASWGNVTGNTVGNYGYYFRAMTDYEAAPYNISGAPECWSSPNSLFPTPQIRTMLVPPAPTLASSTTCNSSNVLLYVSNGPGFGTNANIRYWQDDEPLGTDASGTSTATGTWNGSTTTTLTGNASATTSGSTDIVLSTVPSPVPSYGMAIAGPGIPVGAYVTAYTSSTSTVTISSATTSAITANTALTFSSVGTTVTKTTSGITTSGSTNITVSSLTSLVNNMAVTGPNIPAGTYVTACASNPITISAATTADIPNGTTLTFYSATTGGGTVTRLLTASSPNYVRSRTALLPASTTAIIGGGCWSDARSLPITIGTAPSVPVVTPGKCIAQYISTGTTSGNTSAGATSIVLTADPSPVPLSGTIITGSGLATGAEVISYNSGTKTITVSGTAVTSTINSGTMLTFTTDYEHLTLTVSNTPSALPLDFTTTSPTSLSSILTFSSTSELLEVPATSTSYEFKVADNGGCTNTLNYNFVTPYHPSDVVKTATPASQESVIADCYILGRDKWMTFRDPSDKGKALLSIDDNGNNLGQVTVTTYKESAEPSITATGCPATEPMKAMKRHFLVTPETQPSSNVDVRLYFTDNELSQLSTASLQATSTACERADDVPASGAINYLYVTKYHHPSKTNEDGDYANNAGTSGGIFKVYGDPISGSTVSPTGALTKSSGGFSSVFSGGTAHNYVQLSVSELSEFWIHGSGQPAALPVTMIFLEANPINNAYIQVRWATATEINNDGFWVERSTDGQNWSQLKWIDGHDNSTVRHDYSYDDHQVSVGVRYYYRLKQVDNDSQFEYTDIVSAILAGKATFEVKNFVPNPAGNTTFLTVIAVNEHPITVEFFDILGNKVSSSKHELRKGENKFEFDVSRYAAGTYTAVVTSNNEVYAKKLVVTP